MKFEVEIKHTERLCGQVLQLFVCALEKFPYHSAGQFYHLAVDSFDGRSFWPDSRAFSVFESDRLGNFSFVISRSGDFAERLWHEAVPRKKLWLKGPYGQLNLELEEVPRENDTVFVAAGSGISPFPSMLDSFLKDHTRTHSQASLLFSAKSSELLLGREEMNALAYRYPWRFDSRYFITRSSEPRTDLSLEFRRLTVWDVLQSSRKPLNTDFFLSGPREMVAAVEGGLRRAGVTSQNIHFDDWG